MRSLNPLEGEFYREALQVSRSTREMFCLMEGRHVHPSTLYPGGVGTVATVQLFTDYLTRLMRYVEFMKRVVPMHDDLFDFFYEALPGYEEVGRRRVLLGCWGSLNNPEYCDFTYRNMADWGRKMFVTPGVVVDGKLVTTSLVDINLGIRILLGHSFYEDWEDQEMFVTHDPLGNPVDRRHPWNQHTIPRPAKRDFDDKYSWTMSPRWFDGKDYLPLDTGGGPIARLWATALARPGRLRLREVHRAQRADQPAEDRVPARGDVRVEDRRRTSRASRCPTRSSGTAPGPTSRPTPPRARCTSSSRRWPRSAPGGPRPGSRSTCRTSRSAAASPRRCAACCRTTWWSGTGRSRTTTRTRRRRGTAASATSTGRPGPYEDAVQNTPIFEENPPDSFKGIDIMRAVRSFDPCLPCGVHMYLGGGKVLNTTHSPTGVHAGDLTWPPPANRRRLASDAREAGERVEALLAELGPGSGPEAAGPAEELVTCLVRAVRRRADDDRAIIGDDAAAGTADGSSSPTRSWRACCSCMTCTRSTPSARVRRALDEVCPARRARGHRVPRHRQRRASCMCASASGCGSTATGPSSRRSPTPRRKRPEWNEFAAARTAAAADHPAPDGGQGPGDASLGHRDGRGSTGAGQRLRSSAGRRRRRPPGLPPDPGRLAAGPQPGTPRPRRDAARLCGEQLGEPARAHGGPASGRSPAPAGPARCCSPGAGGRYRTVPDRVCHDPALTADRRRVGELQIPVAIAFFFVNSALGRVIASYPSPAGVTECELDLAAWDRLAAAPPAAGRAGPRTWRRSWSSAAHRGRPGPSRSSWSPSTSATRWPARCGWTGTVSTAGPR